MSLVTLWAWITPEKEERSCFQHTNMLIRTATDCQMMTGKVFKPCMVSKKHAILHTACFNCFNYNIVREICRIFILRLLNGQNFSCVTFDFSNYLGSRRPQPTTAPKPKPPPVPEPEPEPEPTEDPNVDNPRDEQCSQSLVFDAATSIRGDLYFFKTGYL